MTQTLEDFKVGDI